ncbi:MAG TPA: VWA domain-containing protein [Rhodothermales bacterium]|nr:VWA domain-containing protein [Rhodothermales bacterium]
MSWLHPAYLAALLAVPVVIALYVWAGVQRRRSLRRFGEAALVSRLATGISPRRRRYRAALTVLAVGCLALALAGPRFGTKLKEVKREGVDVAIALDVSTSMLAQDVAPNRLARAKNEIKKLLDDLHGDRVALVLFAGDAFVQCPLTSDYNAVRLFLDVAEPSMIPTPGTNFRAAVQTAIQALRTPEAAEDGTERTRVLLIVSDGENHVGGIDDIVERAADAGLTVYAAGIGETSGAPIPIPTTQGVAYKRDRDGKIVETRLEESTLKQLARKGAYFRIGRTSSTLPQIIPALDRLQRTEYESERFETYAEQFQLPLAFALLLLAAERLLPEGRRKPEPEYQT